MRPMFANCVLTCAKPAPMSAGSMTTTTVGLVPKPAAGVRKLAVKWQRVLTAWPPKLN